MEENEPFNNPILKEDLGMLDLNNCEIRKNIRVASYFFLVLFSWTVNYQKSYFLFDSKSVQQTLKLSYNESHI